MHSLTTSKARSSVNQKHNIKYSTKMTAEKKYIRLILDISKHTPTQLLILRIEKWRNGGHLTILMP